MTGWTKLNKSSTFKKEGGAKVPLGSWFRRASAKPAIPTLPQTASGASLRMPSPPITEGPGFPAAAARRVPFALPEPGPARPSPAPRGQPDRDPAQSCPAAAQGLRDAGATHDASGLGGLARARAAAHTAFRPHRSSAAPSEASAPGRPPFPASASRGRKARSPALRPGRARLRQCGAGRFWREKCCLWIPVAAGRGRPGEEGGGAGGTGARRVRGLR